MSKKVITEEPINRIETANETEGYSNQGLDILNENDNSNVIQSQPTSEVKPLNPNGLDLMTNLNKIHIHQEVQPVEGF